MESGGNDQKIYEFADFRLIPGEGLLIQEGVPVLLQPKAFAVLALLVQRGGHLVTKSEIIDTIWEDSFVEEAAVSKAVFHARLALGDSSKEKFIQTVPRRGYRFVASVKVLNNTSDSSSGLKRISTGFRIPHNSGGETFRVESIDLTPKPVDNTEVPDGLAESPKPTDSFPQATSTGNSLRGLLRSKYVFPISAIVLLAAGAIALYLFDFGSTASGRGGNVTIAVLPFHPINVSNRDELYDVGIADALINRLLTIENFQVRSLSSVRRYVDLGTDAAAAGREQKVDYVLASRYQVDGGKIRITAQLINVGTGKTVESYDFLKEVPDAFTAQDVVAFELRDRLAARFGNSEVKGSSQRGTNNEEAYRFYLLAQNFNELRGTENGSIALEQIDRAVALDPNFARAWATKAYIHRYMGYGPVAIEHSLKSIEAVEKAIALDPNLSEAHSVRCFNKFRFEYDFEAAERACKRAIELDPNSPLARKLYSNFLYTRGRFDEAISEIKMAIDLQPVSYDNQQTYALALYFARKYADAEAQWKQLIPLNPNHRLIYVELVKSLIQQGKESEALEHLIKSLTLEKADETIIKRFRFAYTNSGWRGVTLERISWAVARGNRANNELARFYASINDNDNAFKFLNRAFEERSNMIAVIGVDPELDSLRTDARYTELLRKVEERKRP